MSVALATMDSAYGLSRLGAMSHHHLHHHHALRRGYSPERGRDEPQQALRFSVANILRPEFGREAILSTRSSPDKASPIKVTPLPRHSPLALGGGPRDLSFSASRLSPASPSSSSASFGRSLEHSRDGFSPVHRHSSGLSRSGSLESLASSRSSLTGPGSGSGSGSVSSSSSSSAASTAGAESLSGDSSASVGVNNQSLWPAWIYCTRYSDRPSSGPRTRRTKRAKEPATPGTTPAASGGTPDEKRPRTAFSAEQLARLRKEFTENKYLNEQRRQTLSKELGLNEQQIKIWFQNKRAKIKKASGQKNPLALQLMAQGLYNHSTVPVDEDGEEIMPGQE